jgi:redox-sensitive bicupin YhaK (pirin superfamily)
MSNVRSIRRVIKSKPTIEGAGVHLQRVFGFGDTSMFDPFLLLDHFGSNDPRDYQRGFPWHPHRGIETITYVLRGNVEHADSLGNKGIIGSGDVQWMTAGSGIIHQEMPAGDQKGGMWGFQLWANLPASQKMMNPRYRDVLAQDIPEIVLPGGIRIKIIAGEVMGTPGPVRDIIIDPEYLDITLPAGSRFTHSTKPGHTVFTYLFEGSGFFDSAEGSLVTAGHLVLFDEGDQIAVTAGEVPARFLLISGKPLHEPVAWYGPIVMNTQEELRAAIEEYNNGTFIKHP